MKVGIIDYGTGNIASVIGALKKLQVTPVLLSNATSIDLVDKYILPGVGNFSNCFKLLIEGGWTEALYKEVILNEKPILGICLGMQLLATSSSEGSLGIEQNRTLGLNFIPGHVENLRIMGCKLPLPHVGWNSVSSVKRPNEIFNDIIDGMDFYFVHNYAFIVDDLKHLVATTDHGIPIAAAIQYEHIWGTQFHPEKSSFPGLQLLNNFIKFRKC